MSRTKRKTADELRAAAELADPEGFRAALAARAAAAAPVQRSALSGEASRERALRVLRHLFGLHVAPKPPQRASAPVLTAPRATKAERRKQRRSAQKE